MIELIYPYDLAPVIPAPTAETSEESRAVSEWFPIVDSTGLVIGRYLVSIVIVEPNHFIL